MALEKSHYGYVPKFDDLTSFLPAAQASALYASMKSRYDSVVNPLSAFPSTLPLPPYGSPLGYGLPKGIDAPYPLTSLEAPSLSKLTDLSKYYQYHTSAGGCVQDCKYCSTLASLDRAAFYWSLMAMHGLSKYQPPTQRQGDIPYNSRSPAHSVSSDSQPPSPSNSMDDDLNKDTSVKYQCSVCQKSYSHPRLLNRHMQSHTPYKKHHCPRCGKGFNDAFDLKRHIRTHTGVKPFKCSLCEKAFTQRCSLEAHSTRVHGVAHKFAFRERRPKVFVCEDCGETFNDNSKFRQHAKEHSSFIAGQLLQFK